MLISPDDYPKRKSAPVFRQKLRGVRKCRHVHMLAGKYPVTIHGGNPYMLGTREVLRSRHAHLVERVEYRRQNYQRGCRRGWESPYSSVSFACRSMMRWYDQWYG